MRYVAAFLLAQLGGNDNPSTADIKKILGSVGIDCEDERAKKVIDSLKGKNVEDLIAKGKSKLASVPSAAGVAAPAGAAPAAAAAKEEKKEEKKEAKKEEKKEESDEDMGFGLFD